MFKKAILPLLCSAALVGCGSSSDSHNNADDTDRSLDGTVDGSALTLTEGSFTFKKSLGDVVFSNGAETSNPLALDVGFGSGAYHRPGDANNIFYTITDRGPNIKCKDTGKVFGIADFCPADGDKVFPQPGFTPAIYKVKLTKNSSGDYGYEILEEVTLKNTSGTEISGLTNNLTVTDTEISIGADGSQIEFDNEGLDTEAIIRLKDGTYWLTDEYGPSLIHVAADGTILNRVVPSSVAADLADAGYPIEGLLPDILKKRKLNRGIESLAISPDESHLYFSMQSPLANPDKDTYSASRHVRLFKLALNDGEITSVEGQYVYRLDTANTFADANGSGDVGKKQKDVKISEMLAVGNDDLIILERVSSVTKFYRINLSTGANIHGQDIATMAVENNEDENAKALESIYDLASHGAKAVAKVLAFNTLTDMPDGITAPKKLEGIALLDDEHVLLINDNDFGIGGDKTTAIILKIADAFTGDSSQSKKAALNLVARYATGQFDESAAEIVSFHKKSGRIYVVNSQSKAVDVLSGLNSISTLANPLTDSNLVKDSAIDTSVDYAQSGGVNSVAVTGNLLAVAVENEHKQSNGIVAFYSLNETTGEASHLANVNVGALPDNVVFSPDGKKLLVACEGEPSQDYSNDPEGSIAVITIVDGVPAATADLIDFKNFNTDGSRHDELPKGVRIYGGAFNGTASTVAQDLEPEYISVSKDSSTAFVSLQENNALAMIDLSGTIDNDSLIRIIDLGTKDYSKAGNELDVSDKDKDASVSGTLLDNGKARINIQQWDNVVGMYQPDTIASYQAGGMNYVVTANEGDSREYISGAINEDFDNQTACETENFNWDTSVEACFEGYTPTVCAEKGQLNKENEECFSYVEEFRVEDLTSAESYGDFFAPVPAEVSALADNFSTDLTANISDEALGRLKLSIVNTVNADSGLIETLNSYGARSFTIWDDQGRQVFDSGSDMAKITAGRVGPYFNASNDRAADHKKNDRSSAKGPEPEALTIGEVNGRTYAFVGLERVGGIMLYDITNPYGVQFVEYTVNRDFTKDPTDDVEGAAAGDVGPEGMVFVSASDSPTGKALLVVGNEVSGTTSVYEVE